MQRRIYLTTLVVLQLALITHAVPPLSRALMLHAGFTAGQGGWAGAAEFAGVGLAVVGASLALAFPALALKRHRQRGKRRYLGLPRWAVALAGAGAVIFIVAAALDALVPLFPVEARHSALGIARPALTAGLALMAAGALCAELLRRSVAPMPLPTPEWRCVPAWIEAMDPPELRTRIA